MGESVADRHLRQLREIIASWTDEERERARAGVVAELARIDDEQDRRARDVYRRRPCPTGIPGDGGTPYRPSRCAVACTCCAWCRGEAAEQCTCPRGSDG
jgi:hypothetical protein